MRKTRGLPLLLHRIACGAAKACMQVKGGGGLEGSELGGRGEIVVIGRRNRQKFAEEGQGRNRQDGMGR